VKDRVLREALIFNLKDDATWSANFAALNANKKALLAFENVGQYFGPTLFINGANSYQRPI